MYADVFLLIMSLKASFLISSPPVKVPNEGRIILFSVTKKHGVLILTPLNLVLITGWKCPLISVVSSKDDWCLKVIFLI